MENNRTEPGEEIKPEPQLAEVVNDQDMLTEEPVIDRSHASTSSNGPTVEEFIPRVEPGTFEEAEIEDNDHKSEFANEDLKNLSEGEKLDASTHLARAILTGVDEIVRETGNALLPIKKKKLERLQQNGEINLNITLDMGGGHMASGMQAIDSFNEKTYNALSLSQEYKEAAEPIIAAELAKKDIGLTPMQYLLFVLTPLELKRLAQVGMGIRATGNSIIDALKQYSVKNQYQPAGGAQTYGPPPPNGQPQTPQPASDGGGTSVSEQQTMHQQPPPGPVQSQAASIFEDIQNRNREPAPVDVNKMGEALKPDSITVSGSKKRGTKPGTKRGPYKKKK